MTEVVIYNQKGEPTGEKVELNPRIFGLPAVKREAVHFVTTAMLASRRRPWASTKTRGQVRGGGKKPWKQKGTGRARAGSIRSPLWRAGGITFGPTSQRNFAIKVNRKIKRLGIFSALTDHARAGCVFVLDKLELPEGKTRELAQNLKHLGSFVSGRKLLFLTAQKQEKLMRAGRNLPNLKVQTAGNLNILDLLNADSIIILKDVLPVLEKTYLSKHGNS